ncbi:hypothetical protein [Actinomadura rupiterrae]|uniref:hypothetical protein n=1 Tax=Actinomadura rupiterrae TaxID=559627 RepID=UPI0020A39B81|nr:hypothetical protein [Actinomadura rupiterrae]MCP2339216.1 hypothetical protein [Actinomadura rupiterrae]
MSPLQPCGTRAAYARHLYYGEEPCAECRRANADYSMAHPGNRVVAARARNVVRDRHRAEFDALLSAERRRSPSQPPTATYMSAKYELARIYDAEYRAVLADLLDKEAAS